MITAHISSQVSMVSSVFLAAIAFFKSFQMPAGPKESQKKTGRTAKGAGVFGFKKMASAYGGKPGLTLRPTTPSP